MISLIRLYMLEKYLKKNATITKNTHEFNVALLIRCSSHYTRNIYIYMYMDLVCRLKYIFTLKRLLPPTPPPTNPNSPVKI